VRQARNRDRQHSLTVEEYFAERKDNIGTWPSYPLGEQCFHLDIPHDVIAHPDLQLMKTCVSELVTLQNVSRHRHGRPRDGLPRPALPCLPAARAR
jgi:Delta6-protoilludene synthase